MSVLSVPTEAVKFIAFQRTEVLKFPKSSAYSALKRLLPRATYNLGVSLESRFFANRIKKLYARDIEKEFALLRSSLPTKATCILDIGCGVAGLDALLYQHYGAVSPHLYLLDKSQIERGALYGFKARGAFYNSLEIVRALLTENDVPPEKIHLVEANDANSIDIESRPDLIVSLISWGFHYPVATYLEPVYELMQEGASLIMDVRKGTDGLATLSKRFATVEVITEVSKFQRIRALK